MIEWYWLLMMMVALHVFADFHLQGILANMKQQRWWEKQECEFVKEMIDRGADRVDWVSCEKDYIPALLLHAFEWSFIVCIPLMYFVGFTWQGACLVLLNAAMHAYVDDLKCNQLQVSLVTDQLCHLVQILCTLALWTMYAGV
jgi:hypothetical protein